MSKKHLNNKKIDSENFSTEQLLELKQEHKTLEEETQKLKTYLNKNVFNIANNKDDLEDIFEISKSSLKFLEQIKGSDILNVNVPVLEINNLVKYYGNKNLPTLVNVSLRIYLGDLHVVVGNYSSGKTTLFNCLQGTEIYEGEILFDSQNYKHDLSEIGKICGFVPCKHEFDNFSSVENIIFDKFNSLELSESYAKKYIKSSLEQFNLNHIRSKEIIDLSLLEIKKLQLIIALINDPNLVVLDQPLLGLQYSEQIDFLSFISKLRTKERSILIFSHQVEEFSKYANTISLLVKGKIYYTGSIQNLLLNQKNKYALSTSDNKEAVEILKSLSFKYQINDLKNLIYVDFDGQLNTLLFQKECVKKNILITEFRSISVEINDLYSNLLKIGNKNAIIEINKSKYFSPN